MHTREKGKIAEQIVKSYYEGRGYRCLVQNFTVKGGELDLVMENDVRVVCIEVKDVTMMHSLHDYIGVQKKRRLAHAFHTFLWKFPTQKDIACDVVFVKNGKVQHVIDNCIDLF